MMANSTIYPTKESEDREIAALFTPHPEKAFTLVYDKYWLALYNFAYMRIKDHALAENIVQDVFISFWQSKSSIDFDAGFARYLFGAARNRVYTNIKKYSLHHVYLNEAAQAVYPATDIPDSLYEAKELQNQLDESVNKLPPQTRKVFLLSRKDGLTTAEIAHQLQISSRTVETHLHNSLKFLRSRMKAELLLLLILFY